VSGSTTKKAIVDRFDRERIRGFVRPDSYLQPDGVEVLSADGTVALIPYAQVKAVSFVREMEGEGVLGGRRQFLARPKSAGLWVELRFRDGDDMEAMISNNLQLLDSYGYSLSPPETTGNTQHVFVPRQALSEVSVLGVVGGKRRVIDRPSAARDQFRLFGEE
jgi:AICAR transformylase/IMP cyclohydrolase PurH